MCAAVRCSVLQCVAMWHVCCFHLAGAVSPAISPIAAQDTTGFVNHMTHNPVPGNKYVLRKFWSEIPKLSQAQIWSLVQDRCRMVHQTSYIVRSNWGNVKQDSPCWVQAAFKWCDECLNRTSFCIWVKGTQIASEGSLFAEVTVILSPLHGRTVLVFSYEETKFQILKKIPWRIFGSARSNVGAMLLREWSVWSWQWK